MYQYICRFFINTTLYVNTTHIYKRKIFPIQHHIEINYKYTKTALIFNNKTNHQQNIYLINHKPHSLIFSQKHSHHTNHFTHENTYQIKCAQ